MVFEGSSLAMPILGTKKTLRRISKSPDIALNWMKTHYRPERMVLFVLGNITTQQVIAAAEKELLASSPIPSTRYPIPNSEASNSPQGVLYPIAAPAASYSSSNERPIGETPSNSHNVCAIAQTLLNAPYLWGGKNAMGMDCSGFTQVVYATQGINLLRNAREQMTQGELVPSLAEAQSGDLAFFDHADRDPKATNISHVGMLLSPTEIIHCSGCVHIDTIDEQGIHLPDGELTHHLVQIKRHL
jgi:cell wall-associated NlpC family hydrolase